MWTGSSSRFKTSRIGKRPEDALRRAYDELEQAVERRKTELVREIEERKEAEETLRVRDEQLHLLTDNLPQIFAYIDGNGRYAFANKACETRYGLTREDIIGRRPEDVHGAESYAKLRPYIDAALDGRLVNFEEVVRYPDGNTVHARITYAPHFQSSGMVSGYVALSEDVTELKRTGELLQQAQKMEAVGQLTGGVAHDFNNLLAVIMGNSELLTLRLGENDSLLTPIIRATKRGSELTRRLLAFSRQQPLAPRIVNLGALVSGMNEMLGRTLGATIEIEAVVGPGLSNALADPGQVENALLNLALNARDAMAGGGKLTIECANADLDQDYADKNPGARAGAYVSLAVTDDGRGMSQEEQARAFEPFFTTKEVGKGSGLGLSMVYGFASQSNGHVNIYSEAGLGTTVRLYLPRVDGDSPTADSGTEGEIPMGFGETVMVIEDDPDVRRLAVQLLKGLNYRVTARADAIEAERTLADGATFDLILSDVVLPGGVSGPDFAEAARARDPNIKIIFMSGYPAVAARRNGFIGSDGILLNKPFRRRQLAEAIRKMLE